MPVNALLGALANSLMFGFVIGIMTERHYHQPHYNTRPPVELSAAERKAFPLRAKLPPMDVLLHIEDAKTFNAVADVEVSEAERKKGIQLMGWSTLPTATAICEVHIPAGYPIVADSSGYGAAIFVNQQNENTLAHELLHCARGEWHAK